MTKGTPTCHVTIGKISKSVETGIRLIEGLPTTVGPV